MELFKELVDEEIERRRLGSSEESSFYLVQLLDTFVRPEGFYVDVGRRPENPLGPMLLNALHAQGFERFVQLKAVGDLALFLTGFFCASLRKRLVDADYYSRVGGSAYGYAAEVCRPQSSAELFQELASEFAAFALVLHRVSERCEVSPRPDLLQMLDRYRDHGSEHAREVLVSYGVSIGSAGGGEAH